MVVCCCCSHIDIGYNESGMEEYLRKQKCNTSKYKKN